MHISSENIAQLKSIDKRCKYKNLTTFSQRRFHWWCNKLDIYDPCNRRIAIFLSDLCYFYWINCTCNDSISIAASRDSKRCIVLKIKENIVKNVSILFLIFQIQTLTIGIIIQISRHVGNGSQFKFVLSTADNHRFFRSIIMSHGFI